MQLRTGTRAEKQGWGDGVGDVQGFNGMGVEGVLVSSFLSKFGGIVDKASGVFTNCFLILLVFCCFP